MGPTTPNEGLTGWAYGLLERAPSPALLLDQAGRIDRANRAASALFARSPEDLAGRRIEDLIQPELPDGGPAGGKHAREGLLPAEGVAEVGLLRADGDPCPTRITVLPLDDAPEGARLVLFEDLREQATVEAELRYKKALLESQNEASVDGILITDPESRVVSMNQRFADMWGVPKELIEVGGQDEQALASVMDKLEDPEEFIDKIGWLHEHPDAETRDEVAFKDGRTFERWSTPVYGQDGTYYGRGWYFRDITDRKRAERALAHRAEEQARLAELEQLLTVTSHNLVTPLRMVVLYTQLLERRYQGELDEDADEFIDHIIQGARRMGALIEDLRTYAEVGSRPSQLREVDAAEVLKAALHDLRDLLHETGAKVHHEDLPVLQADPDQLRLVLGQLVDNAVKFRGEADPVVAVRAHRKGRDWVFSVEDNGIGIQPEHQERVFSLFERLHPEDVPEGTGLGLTICKRIVERHGGRFRVESTHGQGSTFHFTLPVDPSSLPPRT